MKKYRFCIVGSGWRSEYFARCAKYLPDHFELLGITTTSKERAKKFERFYSAKIFTNKEDMLTSLKPDFVIISVMAHAAPQVLIDISKHKIPALLETPAAPDLDSLYFLYNSLPGDSLVQVAEQYTYRPMQQAHINYIKTGKIGAPVQARVSFTMDYHSISIMRRYLDIGFDNAVIHASSLIVPGYTGYEREGTQNTLQYLKRQHVISTLDFSSCSGIFDYEYMQHRSWIRSQQILVKGECGEINNTSIKYLINHSTPIESSFIRKNLGEDENLEGFGLKGYIADGEWIYKAPYPDSRLVDDEIAVATVLSNMGEYIDSGKAFYSFADAAQDIYLASMINKSLQMDVAIKTETQPWAKS